MTTLFAALLLTGCSKEQKLVESIQGFWEVYQVTFNGKTEYPTGQYFVFNENSFYIGELSEGSCKVVEEHAYSKNDGKKIIAEIVDADDSQIIYQFELTDNGELLITQNFVELNDSATAFAKRIPKMEIILPSPEVEEIALSNVNEFHKLLLEVGQQYQVKTKLLPDAERPDVSLTWESSNPEYASVNDGTIKALKATTRESGPVTISIACGEVLEYIDVYVQDKVITSFSVPKKVSVKVGETVDIMISDIKPVNYSAELLYIRRDTSSDRTRIITRSNDSFTVEGCSVGSEKYLVGSNNQFVEVTVVVNE